MKIIAALIMICLLTACTDTDRASWNAKEKTNQNTCYSGGKLIYEGDSTGVIQTVDHSDGWEFKDAKTGKFIRTSGQCVITN